MISLSYHAWFSNYSLPTMAFVNSKNYHGEPRMNQNNHHIENMPYKLLRLPAVMNKTGKKSSSIYLMIAQGECPRPIKIGARSSAWIEKEIDQWIEQRIMQSR